MHKKIKFICILTIILLITISLAPSTYSLENKISLLKKTNNENWPMYRYNTNRTGCTPSFGPETNKILWRYKPKLDTWFQDSSPVIVNKRVYIGAAAALKGKLLCLEEDTGNLIWEYETNGWVSSTPAVVDDKIYFGSFDTKIHCISIDGSSIWSRNTGYLIFSSPIVVNNKVYIGSLDGKVYCYNAEDGSSVWNYDTGNWVQSSPSYYKGNIYFGSLSKKMYCVNANDGNLVWSYQTGGEIRSTPSIKDDKIYFGSSDNKVYCLNAINGSKIWHFLTNNSVISSPTLAQNKVFVGSYDYFIYCLDDQTGNVIWRYNTTMKHYGSPAYSNEKLYVSVGMLESKMGKILCFNSNNGDIVWEYSVEKIIRGSPSIVNGKLFQPVNEGDLICFCDSQAPNKPAKPIGPLKGKPDVSYEFKTSATDPDGGVIRYGWDWDGDKVIDEWTSFYNSGHEIITEHSWSSKGLFFVHVIAEDETGLRSEWSKPLIISLPRARLKINGIMREMTSNYFLFNKIINFVFN